MILQPAIRTNSLHGRRNDIRVLSQSIIKVTNGPYACPPYRPQLPPSKSTINANNVLVTCHCRVPLPKCSRSLVSIATCVTTFSWFFLQVPACDTNSLDKNHISWTCTLPISTLLSMYQSSLAPPVLPILHLLLPFFQCDKQALAALGWWTVGIQGKSPPTLSNSPNT